MENFKGGIRDENKMARPKKSQFQRQLHLLIVSSVLEQHRLKQSGSCRECSLGRDGIKSSGEMQD